MDKHSLQPELSNEHVILEPLRESDFETLYQIASDPEVWAQHPSKDRWKREVFQSFFEGAMASDGSFIIKHRQSGEALGSSRYYDYNEDENSIFIGYTFYGTKSWGKGFNTQVKKLMLDYIFQYVDLVKFHVGAENWRSRKAMEKLGAKNKGEIVVAYHGEADRLNVEYWISKKDWQKESSH